MFTNFRLQYRFNARFCNPNAGHEKGNVETNVGYIRRNLFVPLITLPDDIEQFNRTELLQQCEQLMASRQHYIQGVPVNELFEMDRKALHELPGKPFIARRIVKQQTNTYGEVVLAKKHRYKLQATYQNTTVLIETYPWVIRIYDVQGKFLEEFTREYGEEPTDSVNLKTCIENVVKKPNSWRNSLFREQLPEDNPLRTYVDTLQVPKDIQRTLYLFSDAMETFSYDTVLLAFQELLERGADVTDTYNVRVCCNRIHTFDPHLSENLTGVDLSKYNVLLAEDTTCSG